MEYAPLTRGRAVRSTSISLTEGNPEPSRVEDPGIPNNLQNLQHREQMRYKDSQRDREMMSEKKNILKLLVLMRRWYIPSHPKYCADVNSTATIRPLIKNKKNSCNWKQPHVHVCTLAFTYDRDKYDAAKVKLVSQDLEMILVWGRRWQVTLAPDKTQLLHKTRNK